ncbi:MAG: type I secretion C-terminal target domain-containing protein [Alphaproteobacteria bacterium]|nr:type I secretion C-terminal target domain-containing protein [Alphaproteobacteria bacterium]
MTRITVNSSSFDFSLDRIDVNVLAGARVIAGAPPTSGFFLALDEAEIYFTFGGSGFVYDQPDALPTDGVIQSIILRDGANGVNQLALIEGLSIPMADFLAFIADPLNGNDLFQAVLRGQPWIALGNNGNDSFEGSSGADTFTGGRGGDTYLVDHLGDRITERPGEGKDRIVTTLASYTLGANLEDLTFAGTGPFTGNGNALNNDMSGSFVQGLLNGRAGNDTIQLGSGADSVLGGAGADLIAAGDGDNVIDGGSGADAIAAGAGADTILGGAGNDVIDAGEGANQVDGGAGADSISAGSDADTIEGGEGDDEIVGGLGRDVLTGGAGADIFRYLTRGEGGDRITDFAVAEDALDLSALVTGANLGGLDYQALFDAGRIQFTTDRAGNVVVRFDANGAASGGLITVATLEGVTDSATLGAGNFILEAPPAVAAAGLLATGEETLC